MRRGLPPINTHFEGLICAGLLFWGGGLPALRGAVTPSVEAAKTSVPAILYLCQNNLQYVAVGYLDAATYAVLYQFKILTAAAMSVLILRRSLSALQWLGLVILTGGACLVILSQVVSPSMKSADRVNLAVGVAAVLSACMASGLAGVYFEKLLKGSSMSLWARNLQLAAYSLFVGVGELCRSSGVDIIGPSWVLAGMGEGGSSGGFVV